MIWTNDQTGHQLEILVFKGKQDITLWDGEHNLGDFDTADEAIEFERHLMGE